MNLSQSGIAVRECLRIKSMRASRRVAFGWNVTKSLVEGASMPRVVVSGSVAWDYILRFPGAFSDGLAPPDEGLLSVSFLASEMCKQRGGCAANITYSLALLGVRATLLASVGEDFDFDYRRALDAVGVDTEGARVFDGESTASCFVTTDQASNQIATFFPGAMRRACELTVRALALGPVSLVVIAPDDPDAMVARAAECRALKVPFLFDPSFQVNALDGAALRMATCGAKGLFMNECEFERFREKTGWELSEIEAVCEFIVVTRGERGASVHSCGTEKDVPAVQVANPVDPTGAGDAFRAGFIYGMTRQYTLERCATLGNLAASFAIMTRGGQSHGFTRALLESRLLDESPSAA